MHSSCWRLHIKPRDNSVSKQISCHKSNFQHQITAKTLQQAHKMKYCSAFGVTLLATLAWIYCCEGAPTNQPADGPHDQRWRLISGLETTYEYTDILTCNRDPLLNVTGDLVGILDGICELLEVEKLSATVFNDSDLHAILEQNALDTCQWLNLLVSMNDPDVSASQRFLELNDTCEIGSMPRLNSYCMETHLDLFYDNIYLPASNFYADIVVDQSIPRWLEHSGIPADDAQSIEDMLDSPPCTE